MRVSLVLVLAAALLGCRSTASTPSPASRIAPAAPSASPAPVSAEYAATYADLSRQLEAWERDIPAGDGGTAPVFGAHVLAANGNRGEELLASGTMASVDGSLADMMSKR